MREVARLLPEGFLEGLAALLTSGGVVTVTLFAAVVFGAVR